MPAIGRMFVFGFDPQTGSRPEKNSAAKKRSRHNVRTEGDKHNKINCASDVGGMDCGVQHLKQSRMAGFGC
jgi:hypothetical protein